MAYSSNGQDAGLSSPKQGFNSLIGYFLSGGNMKLQDYIKEETNYQNLLGREVLYFPTREKGYIKAVNYSINSQLDLYFSVRFTDRLQNFGEDEENLYLTNLTKGANTGNSK